MPALPPFTPEGTLPSGDYPMTLAALRESSLVIGRNEPGWSSSWNAEWRLRLVDNLTVLVHQLWSVGIDEIFIDGSFVEDKDHPNDIDGYFVCDAMRFATGEIEHALNRVDPAKCWTWDHRSRRPYRGYPKLQLPMWHAYRVELYPHYAGVIAGHDEHGNALEFPAFFRKCRRSNEPKGIVRLIKSETDELNEKEITR